MTSVLLDFGGTLARLRPPSWEKLRMVAAKWGLPLEERQAREAHHRLYVARALEYMKDPSSGTTGIKERLAAELFRALGMEADWEGAAREFVELDSTEPAYELYEDALPALQRLRSRGFRLGVVSNFFGTLERRLEELGLREYLYGWVDSAVVGVSKPDPKIIDYGLMELGSDAGRTVYVGDAAIDVAAARLAGVRAAWLNREGLPPLPAGLEPDWEVDSLLLLAEVLP